MEVWVLLVLLVAAVSTDHPLARTAGLGTGALSEATDSRCFSDNIAMSDAKATGEGKVWREVSQPSVDSLVPVYRHDVIYE